MTLHSRAALVLAGVAVAGMPLSAAAQSKIDSKFVVTFAGIEVGRGAAILDLSDDSYRSVASVKMTGLVGAVVKGQGSAASRGALQAGKLVPQTYSVNSQSEKKDEDIRFALSGGAVRDLQVSPPTPEHPDRVAVTEAHKRGIIDPMSAGLMLVNGTGEVLSPAACERTLNIFDGRQRYDLALSFKRLDTVKSEAGYSGGAVVCQVRYVPVSGHRAHRKEVKYLADNKDMEVWLVNVPATRFVVPYKVSVPTMLGTLIIEASRFTASGTRAADAR